MLFTQVTAGVLVARTLYRDRSLMDMNKHPNTATDDRVARSAVFPEMSIHLLRNYSFGERARSCFLLL